MPKRSKPTDNTAPTAAPTTPATTGRHAAWHVRFPGATPARVTVEQAWSCNPADLHIVNAGSRDVVHGRWGSQLYDTWDEAIAASIEQQEAKIRQLEAELAAGRDQLERLLSLTEPEAEPEPEPQPESESEPEPTSQPQE